MTTQTPADPEHASAASALRGELGRHLAARPARARAKPADAESRAEGVRLGG
ncbi:hypothetical protein ACWDA7_39515 [Streptomyces sp. NPDC001156]